MSFVQIISFIALFAIGFYAGLKFMESKKNKKIARLQKIINELSVPEETKSEK